MDIIQLRAYDAAKDAEAVKHMWIEAGWGEYKDHEKQFIETERTLVAEVDGQALAIVVSSAGDIRYLNETLPLSEIGAVITDLTARKLRLSSKLTARRVALDVMDGALVCGLGAFEDGYYNRLGFGTGCYEHQVHFAPSNLKLEQQAGRPRRLTAKDWEIMHRNRLQRRRRHGGCSFHPPGYTRFESAEEGFGFGYFNEQDELTHHVWLGGKGKEEGPFTVSWMAYQTDAQFFELMALIKSFGDQFHVISMTEPPDVALQDLLERPFYYRRLTKNSPLASKVEADAWWQMRICDLEKCLEKTNLPGTQLRFNLQLDDPIKGFLDAPSEWQGIGGQYVVSLGLPSQAECGFDAALPTLSASVGAFTRLWLGAHSARRLALSDAFSAPPELIEELDWAFRLPEPWPEWEF
jgi:predicted acetyltransferase